MTDRKDILEPEASAHVHIQSLSWGDRNFLPAVNKLMAQFLENSGRDYQPVTEHDFYDITYRQERTVIPYIIRDFRVPENDGVIGTATLVMTRLLDGWVAKIEDVVVDKRFRGLRYGRTLAKFIFDTLQCWATGRYKQPIEVYLKSRPDQQLANAMYERMGFNLIATATDSPNGRHLYQKIITP